MFTQRKGFEMNASKLAGKMLDWAAKKKELDNIEIEIKQAVLELGSTQKVGNVTAVCKDAKIEPAVTKEGTPSVTVKIK